jgi:hypothetical protein
MLKPDLRSADNKAVTSGLSDAQVNVTQAMRKHWPPCSLNAR